MWFVVTDSTRTKQQQYQKQKTKKKKMFLISAKLRNAKRAYIE